MGRSTIAMMSVVFTLAAAACRDANDSVGGNPLPDPLPSANAPAGVIAFVSTRDGNPEIYTANANGSNITRLTNDPAIDDHPTWSPDGKRIAFLSGRAGSDASDIYVMNADGSGVTRLTSTGYSYSPAWSPDGKKIAYSSVTSDSRLIYVIDVDNPSSRPTLVGFANDIAEYEPAWSPDGSKVAFTSAGDFTAGLFIADIDGSGIKPLLKSASSSPVYTQFWNAAWSPDGSRLAVVSCSPFPCFDNTSIQLVKPDGTDATKLRNVKNYPRLSWSPDGRIIAFSEDCTGSSPSCSRAIEFVRVDGSGTGVLVANAYSPAWRPEPGILPTRPLNAPPPTVVASDPVASGQSYISAASETFRDAAFIGVRNRTTDNALVSTRVVDGGFDPVAVRAHSGDQIVLSVITDDGDSLNAMMIKVPPRRPPTVVRTSPSKGRTDVALNIIVEIVFTEPVNPATVNKSSVGLFQNGAAVSGKLGVSSDGLTVTFTPDQPLERNTSYTVVASSGIRDLDGDPLEEQPPSSFMTGDPPRGTIAFVSDRDGNPEIYTVNTDGTGLRRLTTSPGKDIDPSWSPDGQRIAFASDRGGTLDLYEMNADGSNVVRRTNGGNNTTARWSRDGKWITYSGWSDESGPSIRVASASGNWLQAGSFGPAGASYSTDPSWSPDGSRIVFASDAGVLDGQQIYVMNTDGTNVRVLLGATATFRTYDSGEIYFQPAWSPDGSRIAVVACHFAPHNCYPYSTVSVVNADGTGLRVLRFAGGDARPAWSPDGKLVAFTSSSCWVCRRTIRYAHIDGQPIANDVLVEDGYSPAWKP